MLDLFFTCGVMAKATPIAVLTYPSIEKMTADFSQRTRETRQGRFSRSCRISVGDPRSRHKIRWTNGWIKLLLICWLNMLIIASITSYTAALAREEFADRH